MYKKYKVWENFTIICAVKNKTKQKTEKNERLKLVKRLDNKSYKCCLSVN